MILEGRFENGVVVFDEPVALANGTPVRVEPLSTAAGCFAAVRDQARFDPAALEAMRDKVTAEQYEALQAIAGVGGPDVDAIARLRAVSLT